MKGRSLIFQNSIREGFFRFAQSLERRMGSDCKDADGIRLQRRRLLSNHTVRFRGQLHSARERMTHGGKQKSLKTNAAGAIASQQRELHGQEIREVESQLASANVAILWMLAA
jgi:hypothetical protein